MEDGNGARSVSRRSLSASGRQGDPSGPPPTPLFGSAVIHSSSDQGNNKLECLSVSSKWANRLDRRHPRKERRRFISDHHASSSFSRQAVHCFFMASAATSPALGTDPPGEPPRYVLVSHGTLADGTAGAGAPSAALSHPIVQYHYADDAPLAVLPRFPGERVLVLDHDPNAEGAPSAKSISDALAVMAVKVTDAPGAGVLDDEPGNKKMYVIETMSIAEDR